MPNAKILEQKQAQVELVKEKIFAAKAGVIVEYKGITVEEDTKLRAEMRKAGVEYSVIKNSILKRAAEKAGMEFGEVLNGTTAMALSPDSYSAAAKVVTEYAKSHEFYKVKSGFCEGKVVGVSVVESLAELPSREELVARALGGLNAPISGFANVLNANLTGLVRALDAIAQKQSA